MLMQVMRLSRMLRVFSLLIASAAPVTADPLLP